MSDQLVCNHHWEEYCSHEQKLVWQAIKEFASSLSDAQKKDFEDRVVNSYTHAMSMDTARASSSPPELASDKKHDAVVATAGAVARKAALTQGSSEFGAAAKSARVMGQKEEQRVDDLQKEIHALTEKYEKALKNAKEQHQKELISVAQEAKEQAIKEADQHGTRLRKKREKETHDDVEQVENAVRGEAGPSSDAAVAHGSSLSELAHKYGVDLGSHGDDVEQAEETVDEDAEDDDVPDKKKGKQTKSKKKKKQKQPPADEEEENEENEGEEGLGIMSGQKKKRKKRKRVEEDGEEEQTDDRDAKPTAAECYRKLQVKGPRELYLVVEQMEELQRIEAAHQDLVQQHNEAIDKLNRHKEAYKRVSEAHKKAIKCLKNDHGMNVEQMQELGILVSKK